MTVDLEKLVPVPAGRCGACNAPTANCNHEPVGDGLPPEPTCDSCLADLGAERPLTVEDAQAEVAEVVERIAAWFDSESADAPGFASDLLAAVAKKIRSGAWK